MGRSAEADAAAIAPDILQGRKLYGDELSVQELEVWFEDEKNGYADLDAEEYAFSANPENYPYRAFNQTHAWSRVRGRQFPICLVLGAASGADVEPIAGQVGRFICIEPGERWKRTEISGVPAEYRVPDLRGKLDLEAQSVDLIVSLGVLHHIPNVTDVLSELSRVLKPGGLLIIREPISSMGGWWRPRPGLTKNERGLPLPWLKATLLKQGFTFQERLVMFAPLAALARKLKFGLFNSKPMVLLDWVLSSAFWWNCRYHRPSPQAKFGPGAAFILATKL